jgi:two-component system, chemotaxis family, chemotaxis protein CheY
MSLRDTLKVLVVDDTATSRGLITQSLDELKIKNYTWEKDGAAAFKTLCSTKYHLVLSDYNMPEMDGLDLLKNIRSGPCPKTAFILITGTADATVINKGRQNGMNNYITKPFTTMKLKSCIEAVTGPL